MSLVDLGSGGGVPGLVLAVLWPETRCLLLESQQRRARFLETWSERLAPSNCTVLRARAEEAGRDRRWREQADVVAARAFGPPAVTAECGAPFLRIGGRLLVSEPPEGEAGRWPTAELARLGLGPAERVEGGGASAVLIDKVRALHERWPRRPGIPNKRPLW